MGREEDSNSTVNGSEVAAHSISLARLKCRVPSRSFGRDGLQEWLVAHQQLPKGPHHVGHPLGLSSNTLCSTDQPCELLSPNGADPNRRKSQSRLKFMQPLCTKKAHEMQRGHPASAKLTCHKVGLEGVSLSLHVPESMGRIDLTTQVHCTKKTLSKRFHLQQFLVTYILFAMFSR